MKDIKKLVDECCELMSSKKEINEVSRVRSRYLDEVTSSLKLMKDLDSAGKKKLGSEVNFAKKAILKHYQDVLESIKNKKTSNLSKMHSKSKFLPAAKVASGKMHPLERVKREAIGIFKTMGFSVVDGSEIESESNNFSLLNIPKDHPARDETDTFWISGDSLLRTHTSSVQSRIMQSNDLPIRVICPGRVYRRENDDSTHASVFHQIEGLLVDEDIKFSDLKGLLAEFCKEFFGEVTVRFRPDYFPFTEPSAEVAIAYKGKKNENWIEIGGCGMVHPNVLQMAGIDPLKWKGLAFGMGVDRLTMLRHDIRDIRLLLEGGSRFIEQF
ncbi:phenylalanine--tRNA ligase subunit alpha [bacterium]|nr:phenylalanine--tRNA ligase subunit alpha [bacterium]|tara:strand:- start:11486 stop:12466 length:981 start_codon:yes stop_codon:yes gene_type:complete